MPKIKFLNERKEIEVPLGANLRKAALEAGVPIYHRHSRLLNCHGLGTCGTCRVLIKKGAENASPMGRRERLRLSVGFPALIRVGHEDELRLACQTEVRGDMEIETRPRLNLYGEKFWA